MSKKLVGIFVSSEFHARSLVESGLLKNLMQKYKIILFTTTILKESYFLNYSSIIHIEIKITDAQTKYFSKHLVLGTLRFINRSTSYKFRLKRQIFGDYYTQNPTFIAILKRVLDLIPSKSHLSILKASGLVFKYLV